MWKESGDTWEAELTGLGADLDAGRDVCKEWPRELLVSGMRSKRVEGLLSEMETGGETGSE